jgi:hypothetical protein
LSGSFVQRSPQPEPGGTAVVVMQDTCQYELTAHLPHKLNGVPEITPNIAANFVQNEYLIAAQVQFGELGTNLNPQKLVVQAVIHANLS